MRALAVTSPGRSEVINVPRPEPGPFDALCRVTYATICAGTDTHVIEGTFGPRTYPLVLGHESIGEVVAVGPRVSAFGIGDHVARVSLPAASDGTFDVAWGGMAEYVLARDHAAMAAAGLPEQDWSGHRVNQVIPGGLMPAALEPMFVTWRETLSFARRAGAARAGRVLLVGSGASALSLAAMAHVIGPAEVTLVGSSARLGLASRVGVDTTLDYTDGARVEDWVEQNRDSVDLVVDAIGRPRTLDRFLPVLRPGGTIAVYGLDDVEHYSLNPLRAGSFVFYNDGYDEAESHAEIIELVRAGAIDASCWIDTSTIFTWANIHDAYRAAREGRILKPVIDLRAPADEG